MNRIISCIVVALLAGPASVALADDPPPTKEQLDAAKKAFLEGDALYRAGKLVEAIEKLKESYRLSRNAMLLYNLGHISDQAGQRENAITYYKKFLATAPANAPKRADVQKRLEVLEKEGASAPVEEATAKSTSKYSETDFKHEVVFTAPQKKPLDIVATVPKDAGFNLTLFYRGSNEATFTKEPMAWKDTQLVATIPGEKLVGNWIQYYIEVRDKDGKLIARSGKSTNPNLISFEGGATQTVEDDPLLTAQRVVDQREGEEPKQPLQPIVIAKWATTGLAIGLAANSIAMAVLAGQQHDKLLADASSCGPPPCRQFDAEYGQKVEQLGARYDLAYKLSLGFGIAAAGVAGYLWYRDLTNKPAETVTGAAATKKKPRWAVAPAIGGDFTGAAVGARF